MVLLVPTARGPVPAAVEAVQRVLAGSAAPAGGAPARVHPFDWPDRGTQIEDSGQSIGFWNPGVSAMRRAHAGTSRWFEL